MTLFALDALWPSLRALAALLASLSPLLGALAGLLGLSCLSSGPLRLLLAPLLVLLRVSWRSLGLLFGALGAFWASVSVLLSALAGLFGLFVVASALFQKCWPRLGGSTDFGFLRMGRSCTSVLLGRSLGSLGHPFGDLVALSASLWMLLGVLRAL